MNTKQLANRILDQLGLEVSLKRRGVRREDGAEFYSYTRSDGSFDYKRYREIQIAGNHRKIEWVWEQQENIEFLSRYIRDKLTNVSFGLCHGTRRGLEQQWFSECLGCEVLGTEISDTAETFANTVQWDFHDLNEDWRDRADFVYSNSFDHAYDPQLAINNWIASLRPGGLCFLASGKAHRWATELDPFGASIDILPYLLLKWSRGSLAVVDLLEGPATMKRGARPFYLVLART